MRNNSWFSAKLRAVCLIEDQGSTLAMDSVFVFRSKSFTEAFERALGLGKKAEKEYLNNDGKRVCWRLKEIVSLDIVQSHELDGAEVFSDFSDLDSDEKVPFAYQFRPEDSRPAQNL